jgi:hypothetical protein
VSGNTTYVTAANPNSTSRLEKPIIQLDTTPLVTMNVLYPNIDNVSHWLNKIAFFKTST